MPADKYLKDLGVEHSHVDHARGDTRNHFRYQGRIYKPNSEIQFEGKRLKILGRMGEGAFGTAWLVMDWETRELFTLKVFKDLSKKEKQDLDRAMRTLHEEASIPDGTIQKFVSQEVGADNLVLYSYVDGKDLSHQFKEKADAATDIDRGMVHTLRLIENWNILAKRGLAHRDISLRNTMPAGTFIDPDGVGRIDELQGEGPLGQAWFLAPEACEGRIHATSDLFSIGVIGATYILGGVPQGQQAKDKPLQVRGWDDYDDTGRTLAKLLSKRVRLGFKKEGYWEIIRQSPNWLALSGNQHVKGFVNMLDHILEDEPEARPQSAEECLSILHE